MKKNASYIDISERKLLLRFLDIAVIFAAIFFMYTYFNYRYLDINKPLAAQWLGVLAIYFLLFGEIFQLYNISNSNDRFLVLKSIVLTAVSTTLFYVFSPYITPLLPLNRLEILYFFFIITIPVLLWRFIYIAFLFSPKFFKNIIVIGSAVNSEYLLKLIEHKKMHKVLAYVSNNKIDGFENYFNTLDVDLLTLVENQPVSELVVSIKGFSEEEIRDLNKHLIPLFKKGINIKSFEKYYEEITDSVPKEYLNNDFYQNINFSQNNDNRFYLFVNTIIDSVVSIVGLVVLLGILPFVFIGNLIGNRGSLFYFQERVGKKGKTFKIVKLRSMIPNAEKNGAVWASKNDSRITLFGKFLRNTRLDEVPQFYNILKGDMNLIGPRPERPEFVQSLEEKIPFYGIRHVVRPGLTGWAQVNYPYASTVEDQETKLRYDLYYIKERNFFLDFKIIIKTITTILFFRGQ